ncbi:MAG: hypothetical protein H7A51_02735 [Akkermansiaceae bacterium]|nr:hypothetical protein [Akkermansiaceae bacterium]
MKDKLPSQITERLEAVLRRVRRLQFFRGMLGVLTLTLASVSVLMAADYLFAPLSSSIRWALFFGLVLVTAGSFWRLFLKPLNRKIELLQVARWLEVKHPGIQERISTSLELVGSSRPGVSENLLKELVHEAELDVKDLNPVLEVRSKKVLAWFWPAAGLVTAFVMLFSIWPEQIGRLFVRAVAPFSQAGNAGAIAFDIVPGNLEVLENDKIEIKVLYQGSEDDVLTLETTRENGDVTRERLHFSTKEDGKHVAVYQLATARESFSYRVTAGRNESDAYKVTVWPQPRLARLDVNYNYPDYTGWAPVRHQLDPKGVQAIVGTRIHLNGTPNTPVDSGTFLIDGKEISPVKIEGSATGGRISIDFPMDGNQSGVGTIVLKHRLGHVIEAARFPVKALPDEAPVVSILTPVKRELRVKPSDQFTITYQVLEEVGLQTAELLVEINGNQAAPLPQLLPTKVKRSKKPLWNGEIPVYVGALIEQHPKAREVKLKLRIKDNRPDKLGGANIGESETIVLKISRSAESLVRQELRAQESDIRETAEAAARDIREAKQKMDAHREDIKQEELPKHTQKQLEEARDKLAKAEKALEELAERMENTVHAPKADKAGKAAEKVKEAREKLETSPLQDTPEEKQQQLDHARKAADEALEEIEKMRQEIEKDRQQVEDVAKLNELAQKERDLARQADKQADAQDQQQTPENKQEARQQERQQQKAADDWKQKQREVQEELRREVNERPEAKAEAAKKQAEKARQLADEARDLSEKQEQLEDLTRQAQGQKKNQPDKQADPGKDKKKLAEDIRQQIEKEQEGIHQQAKEQLDEARQQREKRADQLPEAVAEAKKALDEIRQDQPEKAADAAREAAEKLEALAKPKAKEAAQEKANQGEKHDQGDKADPELQNLAERQEKVAQALEALGDGDADKALEALQELQAGAAKELADDIEAIPEIDGKSGERAQAEQAAQQADDHAREAAKQAGQGNQEAAADRNDKAAEALDQAAEALDAEAAQLDAQAAQQAAQAARQKAPDNQAPADNKQLADAYQKAADAAQADSPAEAAQASQEAAEALSQLAEQAMQNMQRGQKPGEQGQAQAQQGEPGEPKQPTPGEGDRPDAGPRLPTPDPGVPPELAKLGVSLKDWEKLKAMMRSDVGGSEAAGIPEDYRNLVKKYFQEVAREGKEEK